MQENTNKIIAVNSFILYIRLAIVSICQLFITRFALKALGVDDFGLFSVVGSIIIFVGIINTIMISTSNRFIAVAMGRGDSIEVNNVFNASLIIHLVIAILTAIIAFPVGKWYILHYINYSGSIEVAITVFRIVILGSVVSFVSVPYHGLLTAKEKFYVFCGIDILCNFFKLLAAFLMLYYIEDKLVFYASTQAIMTAFPALVYWLYCTYHFPNITKWHFIADKSIYKEMLNFSGWVGYGAIATVGKAQAAQLLMNAFFTTIMNAALGIANTINHFIILFANNITQPMAPQLTKSYASGNLERCNHLLTMSTKFAFLMILTISSPFFSDIDWILEVWLGQVPSYVSNFTKLLLIDTLVSSFNSGISNVIFAHGKIAFYQFTINTLRLLSVFGAYLALKVGASVYSIFLVYIFFSLLIILFTQIALAKVGGFSFKILLKESYLPSCIVCILYVPILFIKLPINPVFHIVLTMAYLLLLIFFIGLQKKERDYIFQLVENVYKHHHK